jgi:hypothetical protein
MNWGAGGGSTVDTKLYRTAADTLRTDDSFQVGGNLTVTGTAAWNKLDEQSPTGTTCTFAAIPQTYRHLRIIGSARGTNAATFVNCAVQINGSASALYDVQQLAANNNTSTGFPFTSQTSALVGECAAATATAGACSGYDIVFHNYRGTSFWKSWQSTHMLSTGTGAAAMHSKVWACQYRGTAAITSIALVLASGNFATGSTFCLYGLL